MGADDRSQIADTGDTAIPRCRGRVAIRSAPVAASRACRQSAGPGMPAIGRACWQSAGRQRHRGAWLLSSCGVWSAQRYRGDSRVDDGGSGPGPNSEFKIRRRTADGDSGSDPNPTAAEGGSESESRTRYHGDSDSDRTRSESLETRKQELRAQMAAAAASRPRTITVCARATVLAVGGSAALHVVFKGRSGDSSFCQNHRLTASIRS